MELLLLSNSTMPGDPFLSWGRAHIDAFLGNDACRIAFIPHAVVTADLDAYASTVSEMFGRAGHEVISLHAAKDPAREVAKSDVIMVSGGNSFHLLKELYGHGLVRAIPKQIKTGKPYVGWSAGSNVACPTIMTTNDMPISEPPSTRALHLVPFQINPHYTEATIPGHGGESRDQRIREYLTLHPTQTVVGLREGALLHISKGSAHLVGTGMRIFRADMDPVDHKGGSSFRADLKDA